MNLTDQSNSSSCAMNSTFKVAPKTATLDFIQYTAPPACKSKRTLAPQKEDAVTEKCPLPELAPNFAFGDLDEFPNEAETVHTPSLGLVGPTSLTRAPSQGVAGSNSLAEQPECEGTPAESLNNTPNESQGPEPSQQLVADQGTSNQQELSRPDSMVLAASSMGDLKYHRSRATLMDSGMDTAILDGDNDMLDVGASAGSAHLEGGETFRARATQERESEEPGLAYDDMDPSDHPIHRPQSGKGEDDSVSNVGHSRPRQEIFESAKLRPQVELSSLHSRFGKSNQRRLMPGDRGFATLKAPHFPGRTTVPVSGYEVDRSKLKSKRQVRTMVNRLHKRSRRDGRFQTGKEYDALLSDSEASYNGELGLDEARDSQPAQRPPQPSRISKATGVLKRRLRRGGVATSLGGHSHPSVSSWRGMKNEASKKASHISGDFEVAVCDSPTFHNPSNPSMTSIEASVLTALVANAAEIGPLLTSPTAWGLNGASLAECHLLNAIVKPLSSEQWQLTATFAHLPVVQSPLAASNPDSDLYSVIDSEDSSDTAYDIQHPRPANRPAPRKQSIRRGGWQKDDDDNLIKWKSLGKSWPWIFGRFPDRTEGAIKSRWYVVLSPQQKFQKDRKL